MKVFWSSFLFYSTEFMLKTESRAYLGNICLEKTGKRLSDIDLHLVAYEQTFN